MPYQISTFQLPDGGRCARLTWTGDISGEDANAALAHCERGGSVHGLPVLALGHQMTGLSREARAIFSSPRSDAFSAKMALVIANPLLRVTANFVLRVRRNTMQRLFKTEADAISWLMEKIS
jgi:hypothetical protein